MLNPRVCASLLLCLCSLSPLALGRSRHRHPAPTPAHDQDPGTQDPATLPTDGTAPQDPATLPTDGTAPSDSSSPDSTLPTQSSQPAPSSSIPCEANGKSLSINNFDVLKWENTSKNGYHSRGHILGTVVETFQSSRSHRHISVQIGPNPNDLIEVIYNQAFGNMPVPTPGMSIEACGDYATSTAPLGRNPSSPDNAIIHWVHHSTSSHDSGYVVLDGVVYGS